MKCIAYLRVSTTLQSVDSQKGAIQAWAGKEGVSVDEWVEVVMSTGRSQVDRRITETLGKLEPGDTLVATEISRIGRSVVEAVTFVETLMKREVRIVLLKEGIDTSTRSPNSKLLINLFSVLAEAERDMIRLRVREGIAAARARGQTPGRRPGVIYPSKYDKHLPEIKNLLTAGVSVSAITRILKTGGAKSLSEYLYRRGLRPKGPARNPDWRWPRAGSS